MKHIAKNRSIDKVETTRISGAPGQVLCEQVLDAVSVEEPLEIRVGSRGAVQQVAVTMRTPGTDTELAVGFLFTEGVIKAKGDIAGVELDKRCNGVTVNLVDQVELDPAVFARHSFVASSCGICGKRSIDAVRVKRQYECQKDKPVVSYQLIHKLPDLLRSQQENFDHTGGIHASCLFDTEGNLLALFEDVGRHNALDKLIGAQLLADTLPLTDRLLMLSGRASFELIQKAAHAGIALIAAVGAPSSLAVQLAAECDITLLGFVRDGRFNIYSGAHRIQYS
ncbi:MAG: formate dehydrogenase accessory sulfurtransferase FdhD [Candidatus Melainabacteria bacterium]|nr:MAG: formate dehydrogenase accessory sulfurtransferase FdhD [Candidatus Melainabacteria bacterium]